MPTNRSSIPPEPLHGFTSTSYFADKQINQGSGLPCYISFYPKQFEMSLQIRVSALLLQRDQRSAASPPLKSVILPTNRSMSPSSAYFTSNIADKSYANSLRAATSRWGQVELSYIADNTKQIKGYPRGEGFHHSYCRQTDRIKLWIWETQLFSLGNRSIMEARFPVTSLFMRKQIKTDGPLRRFNLIKCRQRGATPGGNTYIKCRQTDENGDRAAIFDLFAAREKQIKLSMQHRLNNLFYCRQTNKYIYDIFFRLVLLPTNRS